jgi:uncharacterized protein YrrD
MKNRGGPGMQKVSELVGKPIVSADTGERIGKVSDVLVDPQSQHVIGLVVASGVLSAEHVLPFTDVQTLGTDAVVARSGSGVVGRKEWHQQAIDTMRTSALQQKRVLTTSGRALGQIRDVLVDEVGSIEGFEIAGSGFGGLLRRRSTLPQAHGVTIGADAVLVPEDTAAELEPRK